MPFLQLQGVPHPQASVLANPSARGALYKSLASIRCEQWGISTCKILLLDNSLLSLTTALRVFQHIWYALVKFRVP